MKIWLCAALLLVGAGCATTGGAGEEAAMRQQWSPQELAQEATARTPAALQARAMAPHAGRVSFEGELRFSAPTALNPQGLQVLEYRLDNGLRVLLLEDHGAPVFAYQTWFSVGSSHERPGTTGIAHLFEHLMFKETRHLKEGEFDRIMESHGAQTNAATWLDWTMYREELPAAHLELAVRLEADRIEHMVLTEAQLESEREVVKNERRYRVDNDPEGAMFELLYQTAFTQHPYLWPTIGWMADIEAISLQDCLRFYEAFYAPDQATLVLVGDFDPLEALTLINSYYGHLKAQRAERPALPAEPTQVAERRRLVTMPISSPKLLLGYHSPALNGEDHAALKILHQILFGGRSGRLKRALIDETELATDADAWVGEFTHPALYEVLITLREGGKPEEVEALIEAEIKELAQAPVEDEELEAAKNQLEADFWRELDSVGDRAYQLGHYAITAGDWRLMFGVAERFRAVTAKDVQDAAARYLRPANRTVVIAMPSAPQGG
jgi:zinc protease